MTASPGINEYLDASEAVYPDMAIPAADQLRPFTINNNPVQDSVPADGFNSEAFTDASGNVIVAYEGTVPGLSSFDYGTLAADAAILQGVAPKSTFDDAVAFFKTVQDDVQQTATQNGPTPATIYVTGHSLGGAEAEDVAQLFGVAGDTFGAPGLPGYTGTPADSALIDYVNYGDPVANFASDTSVEAGFAPTMGMNHVGTVVHANTPASASTLSFVTTAFGAGSAIVASNPLAAAAVWPAQFALIGGGLYATLSNHYIAIYDKELRVGTTGPSVSPPPSETVPTPIEILESEDASLGFAGRQDLAEATFTGTSATSPDFTVTLTQDGSMLTVQQNVAIAEDDPSGGNAGGPRTSSDPGILTFDLDQADNPGATTYQASYVDNITGAQGLETYSSDTGAILSDDEDYVDGTSSATTFDLTSPSASAYTTTYYASSEEEGAVIGSLTTSDNGSSLEIMGSPGAAHATISVSGPDGTGSFTGVGVTNADGTSDTFGYSSQSGSLTQTSPANSAPLGTDNGFANTSPYYYAQQVANGLYYLNLGTVTVQQAEASSTTSGITIDYRAVDDIGYYSSQQLPTTLSNTLSMYSINADGLGFSQVGTTRTTSGKIDADGDSIADLFITFKLTDFSPGQHTAIFAGQSEVTYANGVTSDLPEVLFSVAEDVIACFATGTRLLTECGEVAVEDLAIGDLVTTDAGTESAVIWIGHRSIRCDRHTTPRDVWPIRISENAFGLGQPHRPLWLSPDHSIYVDGILIPARALVNGCSIVQQPQDVITYWHVEVQQHSILFAEGLPCESYLDGGNRRAFDNGLTLHECHLDLQLLGRKVYARAPIKSGGFDVEQVYRRLLVNARCSGSDCRSAIEFSN